MSHYLIDKHEADRANIRFKGDEIKLLGDTLTLGIDEAGGKDGYVSSGMSERFLKIKAKTWNLLGSGFFLLSSQELWHPRLTCCHKSSICYQMQV